MNILILLPILMSPLAINSNCDDLISEAKAYAAQEGLTEPSEISLELKQHWLAETQPEYLPGVALLYPSSDGLYIAATFADKSIYSDATGFNQKTWELGDVLEVFVSTPDSPTYWEIHVTPNNHRLQLGWTEEGFNAVGAGDRELDEFLISDPDFVRSSVSVDDEKDQWSTLVFIPWESIGLTPGPEEKTVEIAICRYDAAPDRTGAILSSTADLTVASYHRRAEWATIALTIPGK